MGLAMRFFPLFLALLFLLAGLGFGALNPDDVSLDFYHWQWPVPLGMALIGAALLGALAAGLLLWASVIWPLRRRLIAVQRMARNAPVGATTPAVASSPLGPVTQTTP